MTDCDKKYLEFIGLEGHELDDFARSQHQYIVWVNGYEAGQKNEFVKRYLENLVAETEEALNMAKIEISNLRLRLKKYED